MYGHTHKFSAKLTDEQIEALRLFLPCKLKCYLTYTHFEEQANDTSQEHSEAFFEHATMPNNIYCQFGLSFKQLSLIKYLIPYNKKIISMSFLASIITNNTKQIWSTSAIKGALERLVNAGVVQKKHARLGMLQGVRILLLANFACDFLVKSYFQNNKQAYEQAHTLFDKRTEVNSYELFDQTSCELFADKNTHLFKDIKIERSLYLISDEEMKEIFPKLFEVGFQARQIKEIAQKRSKLGLDTSALLKSLEYAEYELENGTMLDKNNLPVERPENYLYSSLLKNGIYRKPKGYCSPVELLAMEEEAQAEKELEALKNAHEAQFKLWKAKLTEEEKNAIQVNNSSQFQMPEDIFLKKYYTENIQNKV